MALAVDAIQIARTLLNDDGALVWHDSILMPKLKQAHIELVEKFALNGIPVQRKMTTAITVLAGATDLGVNLPLDIIEPSKMSEMAIGDTISNTLPMTEVDYIPDLEKQQNLRYWAWINETIQLLGALSDRIVHLYYIKSLTSPRSLSDALGIKMSESFLGPRVAALACTSIRDFAAASANDKIADTALDRIVRIQNKGQQNLPVRRRPFSYALKNRRRLSY
jgi:hypothetical protein